MKRLLVKQFNFVTLLISTIVCSALLFGLISLFGNSKSQPTEQGDPLVATCPTLTKYLKGYQFIKPILYNAKSCESSKYYDLGISIQDLILKFKEDGIIDQTSVYFKNLNTSDFISLNESEKYYPTSLTKVPLMITYLKMGEQKPGFLQQSIVFQLPEGGLPAQTYKSKSIEPGKSYTFLELLRYMIAYSDNNATHILNQYVDLETFKNTFQDVGLVAPDMHDMTYRISARDYSVFINTIYNGGYLSPADSEFACELLNQCDFKIGIQSGIPDDVKIVHKFGEWGDKNQPDLSQLSESGIIYLNRAPYLLTIMTQGKDVKKLPLVMSEISKKIYSFQKANMIFDPQI